MSLHPPPAEAALFSLTSDDTSPCRESFRISTQERCMDTAWLIADPEPYEEYDLGSLKTGKEAEVFLVERVAPDGRSCLLAHKRYRPRSVTHKGALQELGF